jgi:hypothetical protein
MEKKIDCCFTRSKSHNPEKQKILFLARRNFELLKKNEEKIKALTLKIDPLIQNTPALLIGPINPLLGMETTLKNTVESFEMFFKFPDRWENYPSAPADNLESNMKIIEQIETQEEVSAIPGGIRE